MCNRVETEPFDSMGGQRGLGIRLVWLFVLLALRRLHRCIAILGGKGHGASFRSATLMMDEGMS